MFSNQYVDMRNKLRKCITDTLPGLTTDNIYTKLKGYDVNLTQKDLIPFCKAVQIPVDLLPNLLSPYGIRENRISRQNWKLFFEDEFCTSFPVLPIPPNLNSEQVDILTKFANSIRSRTEQSIASQWIFVADRNPTGSPPARLRLSAFCHIVEELDLVLEQTELIDAILTFYGKKLDELDYIQFAQLMQTFN